MKKNREMMWERGNKTKERDGQIMILKRAERERRGESE